ncbi:MAG: hypothetical protein MJY54_00575 [archaeon]|nr:hypothetical protein [archaeon]
MEDLLCNVEIAKENNEYVAVVHSDLNGKRIYRSQSSEDVLEQLMLDLQDEFESM